MRACTTGNLACSSIGNASTLHLPIYGLKLVIGVPPQRLKPLLSMMRVCMASLVARKGGFGIEASTTAPTADSPSYDHSLPSAAKATGNSLLC